MRPCGGTHGSSGWWRESDRAPSRRRRPSHQLTVTTATPLHYDASCEIEGQRFDDAELRVAGTFGETPGYVRITWQNCGDDPGIEFVAEE
jgi:hypothetical protein